MKKSLRDLIPDYAFLFSVAGISLLLDQYSKWWVKQNIDFGGSYVPPALEWLRPYARFVHWENEGAAFGMFQSGGPFFLVLAIIVTLAITNYFPVIARHDRWLRWALALQMGGAMGNLADRLFNDGAVTDFVSVMNFAVFNVADASISIGTVFILVPLAPILYAEWKQKRALQQAQTINVKYRNGPPPPAPKEEDVISLGALGLLLKDQPWVVKFELGQKVKEIRFRSATRRKRSPNA